MTLTRREWLGKACLVGGLLALPQIAFGKAPVREPEKAHQPITIGALLAAGFAPALAEMRQGRNWVSQDLQKLQDCGRISIRPLGPDVLSKCKIYPVETLSLPMVWSRRDETSNKTEEGKIGLVASLLEKAFDSHDDLFLHRLGNRRAIVSPIYHYDRGDVCELSNHNGFVCKMFTAVAFID